MIRHLSFALALAFTLPAHASERDAARAWVEQKNYPAALEILERLAAQHPDDADLLIETARVHAWADRHEAAIRHYQAVVARFPDRRSHVVLPLAWQLLWHGQAAQALPWFDEATQQPTLQRDAQHGRAESLVALQRLPEAEAVYLELARDPVDLKAQKGSARLAIWQGQTHTAIQRYTELAARLPDDKEVRIGLARALNERGAHQAAARQYAAAVANDTTLAQDTRIERARTLRWAGLDYAAIQTLDDASGADDLRQTLRRDTASHLRTEIESAHDSDELDVHALTVGWQPHRGASLLDASVRLARIEQNNTRIDGQQFLLRASSVFGETHGILQPALTLGARDYDGWTTGVWKIAAKWLPADFWRIDFEAGNDVVETSTALQQQVEFNYAAVGADWNFAPRWLATLGISALDFDDNNQRRRLVGKLAYTWLADQPRIITGIEAMRFTDSDPTISRGYYNPDTYREAKAFAQAEHRMGGWLLAGRLALGRLSERPGGDSNLFNWELSAERAFMSDIFFRVYASGSDSSSLTGSGSGYERTVFGASLHWLY